LEHELIVRSPAIGDGMVEDAIADHPALHFSDGDDDANAAGRGDTSAGDGSGERPRPQAPELRRPVPERRKLAQEAALARVTNSRPGRRG
jgi:hypothetical protein